MTPAQTERKIAKFVKKWRPLLGLNSWDISLQFFAGVYIQADGVPSTGSDASCHASWPYMSATIAFDTDSLSNYTDRDLEVVVVHELAHVLVNEMREPDPDVAHEERVTTMVAWALVRALYDREYR